MTLEQPRATLVKYHAQQEPESWAATYAARDHSIDNLPVRTADRYIAGNPGALQG